jgi:pyruvate dehydrogenase E2 component (dihydrolipoamide acetyltransferase)
VYEVKFADIGEGIHEGVLFNWLVSVGEVIHEGQGLFMVETDKVTAEIPSPVSGTIKALNGNVGELIYVGHTIVVIDDGVGTELPNKSEEEPKEQGSTSVVGEIEVSSDLIPASRESDVMASGELSRPQKVLATPVARQLAKDLVVDLAHVNGTGPNGRIMKEDILLFKRSQSESKDNQPIASGQELSREIVVKQADLDSSERVKMSMRRKSIAKNMTQSKSMIPHAAAMDEIDVTDLVAFKAEHKAYALELGIKLTYMPFIVKAVVLSLQENPVLNASLDSEAEEIILKKHYNIGFAVDHEDGLMVPVLQNANHLSIFQCAEQIQTLTKRIREHRIQLQDLQGGTFSITNYGTTGTLFGVPVIRFPEVAILGVGTIQLKPVVRHNAIEIRSILPISIAFDHRVVDGGDAGRFIMSLKKYLTNPSLLLLK